MTRVLGLSGEGELVLALPHADDTRAFISGVLIADLKRNIKAVNTARDNDGANNTVGLLREISRVAKIYEELLSGTDAEEPTTKTMQIGALRYAEAAIGTASGEMASLKPSAASSFQSQQSVEPVADASTPSTSAPASRTRDRNTEAPSREESDKEVADFVEAVALVCDETWSISDVLPVVDAELSSSTVCFTQTIEGHGVAIQHEAVQDNSTNGQEDPCCVALPSFQAQPDEHGLEPLGGVETTCTVGVEPMGELSPVTSNQGELAHEGLEAPDQGVDQEPKETKGPLDDEIVPALTSMDQAPTRQLTPPPKVPDSPTTKVLLQVTAEQEPSHRSAANTSQKTSTETAKDITSALRDSCVDASSDNCKSDSLESIKQDEAPEESDFKVSTTIVEDTTLLQGPDQPLAPGEHQKKEHSEGGDPKPIPAPKSIPLPTRYTATKEDLELYILVPANVREYSQYQQWASENPEFFMSEAFDARGDFPIGIYRKPINDLGHVVIHFDMAEERDEVVKNSRSWLQKGYRCEQRLYEVEVAIKDAMAFDYLVDALETTEGKRRAADQLTVDNDVEQGKGPRIRLMDLDWAVTTKRRLQSGTRKPPTSDVYGTLVLYLATLASANEIILADLWCCGIQFPARIRWPKLNLLQCQWCGKLGHCSEICNQGDRCLRCSSSEHEADACDCETSYCILCGGDHHSTATSCEIKRREMKRIDSVRQSQYTFAWSHDRTDIRRIFKRG